MEYLVQWLHSAEPQTSRVIAPDAASAVALVAASAQPPRDGKVAFELLSVVPVSEQNGIDE